MCPYRDSLQYGIRMSEVLGSKFQIHILREKALVFWAKGGAGIMSE